MDRTKLREDVARAICCPSGKCRNAPSGGPIATNADVIGCLSIMHSQAADAAVAVVLAGIRTCLDDCYATGADFEAIYAKFNATIDRLIQKNGKEPKGE